MEGSPQQVQAQEEASHTVWRGYAGGELHIPMICVHVATVHVCVSDYAEEVERSKVREI